MTEGEVARGACGDCLRSELWIRKGSCFRKCQNLESKKYGQLVSEYDSCEHYDGVFPKPEGKER